MVFSDHAKSSSSLQVVTMDQSRFITLKLQQVHSIHSYIVIMTMFARLQWHTSWIHKHFVILRLTRTFNCDKVQSFCALYRKRIIAVTPDGHIYYEVGFHTSPSPANVRYPYFTVGWTGAIQVKFVAQGHNKQHHWYLGIKPGLIRS